MNVALALPSLTLWASVKMIIQKVEGELPLPIPFPILLSLCPHLSTGQDKPGVLLLILHSTMIADKHHRRPCNHNHHHSAIIAALTLAHPSHRPLLTWGAPATTAATATTAAHAPSDAPSLRSTKPPPPPTRWPWHLLGSPRP